MDSENGTLKYGIGSRFPCDPVLDKWYGKWMDYWSSSDKKTDNTADGEMNSARPRTLPVGDFCK